jgi:hypothetical protein
MNNALIVLKALLEGVELDLWHDSFLYSIQETEDGPLVCLKYGDGHVDSHLTLSQFLKRCNAMKTEDVMSIAAGNALRSMNKKR